MNYPRILILLVLLGSLSVLAGCGGQSAAHVEGDGSTASAMGHEAMQTDLQTELHADTTDHDGDQAHDGGEIMGGMVMDHGVPEEAEAVTNPVPATEASIAAGAQVFQANCAACHGEQGHGDGPASAALEPKPANLGADHVQANSDGALFWIITHGRTGTAMPPWESVLSEEQRWEVVNFIRMVEE